MSALVRAIRGRCSFCAKSAEEVAGLVAPAERSRTTTRICSECLAKLVGVGASREATASEGRSRRSAACDFCGFRRDDQDDPDPRPRICHRCIRAGTRLFAPGAVRIGSGTSVGRRGRRVRLNQRISSFEVRVIDHDGGMLGVMQTADALSRARKVGLDLVEVNPKKSPPVCKILDYGRFKYEQLRDARRQRNASDRNLRLGPHADRQDVDRKLRLAREYLGAGRRVSLSVQPRGGEVLDPSRAESLLDEFAKLCADIARVVRPVPIEERTVTVTLVPLRLSSRESHEPK